MQQITVDDRTYEDLKLIERYTGKDSAQIIAELLVSVRKNGGTTARPVPVTQSTSRKDADLLALVSSPAYLANRSVVDQFLEILAFVYKQDPSVFQGLERLEGRTRKYFAQTADELESSGSSVNPKEIPNAPFWVVTNKSTATKKTLLGQALTSLGYERDTVRRVVETLR